MRAARFYDRGDIRIDEINEPIVKAGQVGIDVAWCGIFSQTSTISAQTNKV